MSSMPLFRKVMRDTRWLVFGMAAGILFYAFIIVVIYPLFEDSLASFDENGALEGFLGATGSIASPEGYLQSQMFVFTPILVIVMAIITGTAAFVGEQDAGTMDIVLAQPLARKRLAIEKTLALSAGVLVASLMHWPGVALGTMVVDFEISLSGVFGATIMTLPVCFMFLTGSLLASAAFPTRSAAAMAVTAILVVTYFANIIGATSDSLEWLLWLSPFYWSDSSIPLVEPFPWERFLPLMAIALAMGVATIYVFERRDIAAGNRDVSLLSFVFGWLPKRSHDEPPATDAPQSAA